MTRFGSNLKAAREAAGLTQEDVASRMGYKRATPISIWEIGRKFPEPQSLIKLARAIGCTTAQLLDGVETPYDALRAPGAIDALRLNPEDYVMYAAWRQLSPAERKRHAALIVQHAAQQREHEQVRALLARRDAASQSRVNGASTATRKRRSRSR